MSRSLWRKKGRLVVRCALLCQLFRKLFQIRNRSIRKNQVTSEKLILLNHRLHTEQTERINCAKEDLRECKQVTKILIFYACQKEGHYAFECPQNKAKSNNAERDNNISIDMRENRARVRKTKRWINKGLKSLIQRRNISTSTRTHQALVNVHLHGQHLHQVVRRWRRTNHSTRVGNRIFRCWS